MKAFVILTFLLCGLYMLALSMVSSQLKEMANYYYNVDQVTTSIASGNNNQNQINTKDLKAVVDSYTNILPGGN